MESLVIIYHASSGFSSPESGLEKPLLPGYIILRALQDIAIIMYKLSKVYFMFQSYNRTPLIRSPWVKKIGRKTGWSCYRGRLKFHELRFVMRNTPYNAFAFLEQQLINNWDVP